MSELVNGTGPPPTTGVGGKKGMMRRKSSTLHMDNLNPCIQKMEYAVRGPLVRRATEMEKEIERGEEKPFHTVIKAGAGEQPPGWSLYI